MKPTTYKVRWADVDANGHLRHSAYADFCAHARVEMLEELGLSMPAMRKLAIGPILFREELVYKREIGLSEEVSISTELQRARKDASRWSFKHSMYKQDGVLACEVFVEGAWLDLKTRKLGGIPESYSKQMLDLPKTEDFAWEEVG